MKLAVVVAAGLAGLGYTPNAAAQDPAPIDEPPRGVAGSENLRPRVLSALVAQLESDDPRQREAATLLLTHPDGPGLDEMLHALADPGLGPEARSRLNGAALARFIASRSPGLGIRMADTAEPEPVRITEVIPGFAAADFLRPDDEVIEIDGRPVLGSARFRVLLQSHLPGELLHAKIRRLDRVEGRPAALIELDMRIPLGDYGDLGAAPVDEQVRTAAFGVRRERVRRGLGRESGRVEGSGVEGSGVEPVIGSGHAPERWLEVEGLWPPPTPRTPIGETGLVSSVPFDPRRVVIAAGVPQEAGQPRALARAGEPTPREPLLDGLLATGERVRYLDVAEAYRERLRDVARVEWAFMTLDARSRTGQERAAELRRRYDEQLAALGPYVSLLTGWSRDGGPDEAAGAGPDAGPDAGGAAGAKGGR